MRLIILIRVFVDGAGDARTQIPCWSWILQTSDTLETGRDPKWETRLEVGCAMPPGTTVTRSEMRVATESVKAVVSVAEHGKAMFNLDGQVLEKR